MSDPRITPTNGRVAHRSLTGQVEAEKFTEGTLRHAGPFKTDIRSEPGGGRVCELLPGSAFRVLEEAPAPTGGIWSYGFREIDGYCGYVATMDLVELKTAPSHAVSVRETYHLPEPELKSPQPGFPLPFGSRVTPVEQHGAWMRVDLHIVPNREPVQRFIPAKHIAPIGTFLDDTLDVAAMFLGAPYVWGGNAASSMDCSGLVQTALHACGMDCPRDSDQQEEALGQSLIGPNEAQRGDLLFWKGHVAFVVDQERILHANAHAMSTTYEGFAEAIDRIERQGGGPVTSVKRITPQRG